MIVVAGHWELSWNTPIKEAELWNLPLRDFGIEEWYMWPVSGIKHNEHQRVHLYEREDLKTILEENPDIIHVYVEPEKKAYPGYTHHDLRTFSHPKDVMYIFGSAHYNPILYNFMREQDIIVKIPTAENAGALWPHQCLVTVLYDRIVKNGSTS
jgi:hypothetical protein